MGSVLYRSASRREAKFQDRVHETSCSHRLAFPLRVALRLKTQLQRQLNGARPADIIERTEAPAPWVCTLVLVQSEGRSAEKWIGTKVTIEGREVGVVEDIEHFRLELQLQ